MDIARYREAFIPEAHELLSDGESIAVELSGKPGDGQTLVRLIRTLHTVVNAARMFLFDDVAADLHLVERVADAGRRGQIGLAAEHIDLILAAIDEVRARLRHVPTEAQPTAEASNESRAMYATLQEWLDRLTPPADAARAEPEAAPPSPPASPSLIGQILATSGLVEPAKVEAALSEQQHLAKVRKERTAADTAASIRVAAEQLDNLVNLIGELVSLQTRLTQVAITRRDAEAITVAQGLQRLTDGLRDSALNIRMLPIGTLFNRFRRLVRDLGRETGRDVELLSEGGTTELDKTVIERLDMPIAKLIRHCVLHDLEGSDERETHGKPGRGTIRLTAARHGDKVRVQIASDGRGVDPVDLRSRAETLGLVGAQAQLTAEDVLDLLFAPGISGETADDGLAKAKQYIDNIRGTIEISNHPGAGLCFDLELPLNLAIFDGLLVTIGERYFVLPLGAVVECLELTATDRRQTHGRPLVRVRGDLVPYLDLRQLFGVTGERPPIEQVVVAMVNRRRLGFTVDRVVGDLQTVIKPLGRVLAQATWFSGGAILGDGNVALVLNPTRLAGLLDTGRDQN